MKFAPEDWSLLAFACQIAVPIALLSVVGGQDYDNCPANDDLPRWMICSGVFQAVLACLLLVAKCKKPDLTFPDGQSAPFKASVYLVAFTHFCVFIWGTVTVFGPDCDTCDQHEENKEKGTGCHSVLYDFSFWWLVVQWIIIALVLIAGVTLKLTAKPSTATKGSKTSRM